MNHGLETKSKWTEFQESNHNIYLKYHSIPEKFQTVCWQKKLFEMMKIETEGS